VRLLFDGNPIERNGAEAFNPLVPKTLQVSCPQVALLQWADLVPSHVPKSCDFRTQPSNRLGRGLAPPSCRKCSAQKKESDCSLPFENIRMKRSSLRSSRLQQLGAPVEARFTQPIRAMRGTGGWPSPQRSYLDSQGLRPLG